MFKEHDMNGYLESCKGISFILFNFDGYRLLQLANNLVKYIFLLSLLKKLVKKQMSYASPSGLIVYETLRVKIKFIEKYF